MKRHSTCTPPFHRKNEPILFRGRKTILPGARILEPRFIIGGWSVANLVYANGTADPPTNKDQFTNLDEYGRPNPDGGRFPSAIVGGGDGE